MMFAKPAENSEKTILREAVKAAQDRVENALARLNRRLDRQPPPKEREND